MIFQRDRQENLWVVKFICGVICSKFECKASTLLNPCKNSSPFHYIVDLPQSLWKRVFKQIIFIREFGVIYLIKCVYKVF